MCLVRFSNKFHYIIGKNITHTQFTINCVQALVVKPKCYAFVAVVATLCTIEEQVINIKELLDGILLCAYHIKHAMKLASLIVIASFVGIYSAQPNKL